MKISYEIYRHAVVGYFVLTGANKQWAIDIIDSQHTEIRAAFDAGVYHADWARKFLEKN